MKESKPDLEVQTGKPPVGPAMSNGLIVKYNKHISSHKRPNETDLNCSSFSRRLLPLLDMTSSALLKCRKWVNWLCGHRSRCDIQDLRCRDDLISGSPDEQDWSLVSGGRQQMRFLIISSSSMGFHTNLITHFRSWSTLLRFMYCLTVYCTNGPKRQTGQFGG